MKLYSVEDMLNIVFAGTIAKNVDKKGFQRVFASFAKLISTKHIQEAIAHNTCVVLLYISSAPC